MRENEPYIKLSTMIGSRFRKKRTIFYHIASKSGGRSLDVDIIFFQRKMMIDAYGAFLH